MLKGQLPHWNPQKITIKQVPRVGQAYWIGLVEDSTPPEFDGYHPGIIIRSCSTLVDTIETVSFVPITSKTPQKPYPYIYQLTANPNPTDKRSVWAICNHIYTVRLSRLELYMDLKRAHVVPKIPPADIKGIFAAIRNGFVAMRSDIEAQISEQVEVAREALEQEFDARVAQAVEAELDRLTSPGKVA
ncbi:MAG: type II toxin-antitoxin system PemK/MazF family toxin [Alphaproteobacteria bacterium]|nr:type II toxin-antitoxin system PemK/MazF family toxin [Alphaproteobacteria bacterium]